MKKKEKEILSSTDDKCDATRYTKKTENLNVLCAYVLIVLQINTSIAFDEYANKLFMCEH